jgi:hypothetical protein
MPQLRGNEPILGLNTNIQIDIDKQKEAKSPLRIIRKNHPKKQIIGDINEGV